MKKKDLEKLIKELASKEFKMPIDKIRLESSLILELGVDSLSMMELIMAIEERLSIKIPDTINNKIDTLQDIINFVAKLTPSSK